MPTFAITLAKVLQQKMRRWGIRQEDIREGFIRSSGPGGQNVNKTATCVYLKHLPSGMEVRCQNQRSQAQNRALAWKLLIGKIETAYLDKQTQARAQKEKLRRMRRKRPQGLKLRILEEKRKHSQKKALRQKLRQIELV
jgi:protein subunit release factor B